MNHNRRKWTEYAWSTQLRTAQDLVSNPRMVKWPDGGGQLLPVNCKHRHSVSRNKRMAAQALRIPRKTQVRLARAMMVRSNQNPN